MEEIPPTHYAASRAASVAENCINYQQGTPHKVFLVQTVQQASKEVSLRDGEAQRIGLPCYSHPDPGWAGLGWAGLGLLRLRIAFLLGPLYGTHPRTVCFHSKAENLCRQILCILA